MKKIGELKFFPTRGILKLIYKDGSEKVLKDPKVSFFPIKKIPEEGIKVLKDKTTSRIFYLLLLRPYNKYMLAATYYGRWRNIPRVRVDMALKKLRTYSLIQEIPWSKELAKKFEISRKSRHIYKANASELLKFILSENNEIRAEFYLLVQLVKCLSLEEVYFEWSVTNLRKENVDVMKLIKMKFHFLILLSLLVKSRGYRILERPVKLISENMPSMCRKIASLLQIYEAKPILEQFVNSIEEEIPEIILNEIHRIIIRFFGKKNDSIFKLIVFLLVLPEEIIEELLEKLSIW